MLPEYLSNITMPVKSYLACYRANDDCQHAIKILQQEPISFSQWKVQWAGICALLKTSIHLMRAKDAKSCLPLPLRNSLLHAWQELGRNKDKHPIFWEFIDKERHNILKEYEYSAYEVIIAEDGTIKKPYRSLLSIMAEGEKRDLIIKHGYFQGKVALDLLMEASEWIEEYIFQAIREAGYDPEEMRRTTALLPPLPPSQQEATNRTLFIQSLMRNSP